MRNEDLPPPAPPSDAKRQILQDLAQRGARESALPDLEQAWTEYPDAAAVFAASLAGVGGQCHRAADRAALATAIGQLEAYRHAQRTCSTLPDIVASQVDLAGLDDPHALADVDLVITSGRLAVAENGAVWIDDRQLRHRAILFLTQHLVLVVPAGAVVSNMHQAYAQLEFAAPGFGVFLSGPSKTADIEQSLVIGAHGAKSLHVFLLEHQGGPPAPGV